METEMHFEMEPVGFVRSELRRLEDAPMQGFEGAPAAWIELNQRLVPAMQGLAAGDSVILISWFHLAARDVLQVHPRDDLSRPMTGVFATRSPDRPNPLGLHGVTILELDGNRLRVEPLEAIDGTPIVDIKPVMGTVNDA